MSRLCYFAIEIETGAARDGFPVLFPFPFRFCFRFRFQLWFSFCFRKRIRVNCKLRPWVRISKSCGTEANTSGSVKASLLTSSILLTREALHSLESEITSSHRLWYSIRLWTIFAHRSILQTLYWVKEFPRKRKENIYISTKFP